MKIHFLLLLLFSFLVTAYSETCADWTGSCSATQYAKDGATDCGEGAGTCDAQKCCTDKAQCSSITCSAGSYNADSAKYCATDTCTEAECCTAQQQCSAWDANNDCDEGTSAADATKYCATDTCTKSECCEDDPVTTTVAPTTAAPTTTVAPEDKYPLGDLVLSMTVSFVSSLFLSITLYFFTNTGNDLSSYELVPLVTSRRKRNFF